MTVWSKVGKREKSCKFLPSQLMGSLGAVGFSEDRVLLTFHDDPAEKLTIVDMSRCEVKERTELKGTMVVELFPAPGGWTATGPALAGREYSLLRLDLAGKVTDSFSVPDEIRDDIKARIPALPFERSIAISVGREVWLLPSASYGFIRPPQHGKGEYSFEPPSCLAAEARELQGEEQIRFLEKRVESATGADGKRAAEATLAGARKGKGRTTLAAIATAASYRGDLGVLVRYDRGGRRGCRLDVWDLTAETVVAMMPIGGDCGGFLAMSDEGAWIAKGGMLQLMPLPSLTNPLKQPCAALREVVKTVAGNAEGERE